MKRDGLICGLIIAYCTVIGLFTLKPQMIMADPQATIAQSATVQAVHFKVIPDSPDPNQVLELVNKERAAQGSPVLIANEKLTRIAAERAADMATRQYYAHKNPDGNYYYNLFPENGVTVDYSCENLNIVFVPDINLFINEWLASTKGHRNCMVNASLKEAGYAVTKMMLLEYGGKEVPAYVVVAIHTTQVN
jgi:uncharacterized protein YkwD